MRLVQSRLQKLIFAILVVLFVLVHGAAIVLFNVRCGRWDPVTIIMSEQCPIGWSVIGPIFYVGQGLDLAITLACGIVPAWLMIRARGVPAPCPSKSWPLIILCLSYNSVSLSRLAFVRDIRFGSNNHHHAAELVALSVTKLSIGMVAAALAVMQPIVGPAMRIVEDWSSCLRNRKLRNRAAAGNDDDRADIVARQDGPIVLHTAPLRGIGLLPNTMRSKEAATHTEESTSTILASEVAEKSMSHAGIDAAKDKTITQSICEVGNEDNDDSTKPALPQQPPRYG